MSDNKKLIVEGFAFQYEADAELAREENKKVVYLEQRVDVTVKETVLGVYQKALDSKTFLTPVGWDYMMQLRRAMLDLGMAAEDIPPIPLYMPFSVKAKAEPMRQKIKPADKPSKKEIYQSRFQISLLINLILAVMVIAMFVITIKSNNPNILNYESAILDKYAAWEQDLSERERAVREKEYEYHLSDENINE